MSIVARGLGSQGGLIVTYGLGATTPVLVVLYPLNQEVTVQEILQSIDLAEFDVHAVAAEINMSPVVREVLQPIDQVEFDIRTNVAETTMSVMSAEVVSKADAETQVIVVEVVDAVRVGQSVGLDEIAMTVSIAEVDHSLGANETIDKLALV